MPPASVDVTAKRELRSARAWLTVDLKGESLQ
jgi:hypothetical protein